MAHSSDKSLRPIVILGAGYAGLTVARALGKGLRGRPEYQVVLVDRSDAHELKPKLPEAVGEWIECTVQVPLADVVAADRIRLFQTTVTGLDPVKHVVLTEAGALPYWRLIVALGAQPDFAPAGRSIPGLADVAIAPYSQGQACRLRHHLARVVEQASLESSADLRDGLLTVVVAGGGFVGAEIAGELADRLVELTWRQGLPARAGRVILIEPQARVVGFEPQLNDLTLRALLEQGVDVRLGVGLAQADSDHVSLTDGSRIATRTLVWTGGIRGNAVAAGLGLPTDEHGRIHVDASLRLIVPPDIYAIGDIAHVAALDHRPQLVNSGQAAVAQGELVARAVLAEIHGRHLPVYQPHSRGVVIQLGHHVAVARLGPLAPVQRGARWLKQVPMLEHVWRLGGPRLLWQYWSSTVLPLLAPDRVPHNTLAGDRPTLP